MVKNTEQDKPKSKVKKFIKYTAVGSSLLFFVLFIAGIHFSVQAANAAEAARVAEQARLSADPVTVSGVYSAHNKERAAAGAPALATLPNLTTSAEQMCNDMVAGKYFDYKNPASGKDSNSFITDNAGDLYLKNYVSSIFSAMPSSQTATDAVKAAVANQATNLNSPLYNSVGWATCESQKNPGERYIVGMLANKQERPVAPPAPVTRYVPTPTYTPTYRSPTTCHTQYRTYTYFDPSATTTCY